MVGMWLFGDMYKVSYYESKESPAQLVICAFLSCMIDCSILSQFWVYRKLTSEESAKNKSNICVDTESGRDSITVNTTGENNLTDQESVRTSDRDIELTSKLGI